jgi:hypothetical protein
MNERNWGSGTDPREVEFERFSLEVLNLAVIEMTLKADEMGLDRYERASALAHCCFIIAAAACQAEGGGRETFAMLASTTYAQVERLKDLDR